MPKREQTNRKPAAPKRSAVEFETEGINNLIAIVLRITFCTKNLTITLCSV